MASVERELLETFEAARKAAATATAAEEEGGSPSEVDRCVRALMRLREMPVTVKALVDTQVGKQLRIHLTKHPLKRIQKAAFDLCELWKKKVIEETAKNKKSATRKNINMADTKTNRTKNVAINKLERNVLIEIDSELEAFRVERRDCSEKTKVENVPSVETNEVEKTFIRQNVTVDTKSRVETVKAEKIAKGEYRATNENDRSASNPFPSPNLASVIKCNDAIRDKTRELFVEVLSKVSGEVHEDFRHKAQSCDPVRVAITLESLMFEKLGRSNGTHKVKYRSLLFNLKDQNNPDLRRRVLLGEIRLEDVVNMTAEEMASDERRLQNTQIKEKALFDCERGAAPKATTDQFQCSRCGQRKCTYYQMQTRSADEPMTTYVTCVNCNNHWKFC